MAVKGGFAKLIINCYTGEDSFQQQGTEIINWKELNKIVFANEKGSETAAFLIT